MRLCKEKIVAMVICIVFMLIAGTCFYSEYIRVQNIFDQRYYTRIRTHYDWWEGALGGSGNKQSSFSKMPQIEPVSRDEESFYTEMQGFMNYYQDEYLREGESLVIDCRSNEKKVYIVATKRFNGFEIVYSYTYDIEEKCLQEKVGYVGEKTTVDIQEVLLMVEKSGLTKEDLLQYKKYFLYDKLLTDWLAVNESGFSINDLGNVEFIEVLPLEVNE